MAAAFGIGLLVLALLLMWGYYRATRVNKHFRVVTGKGFRPRRIKLGPWRYPALVFVAVYFGLMVLPLLILIWTSLLPFYQVPSTKAIGALTLDNYRSLFESVTITSLSWQHFFAGFHGLNCHDGAIESDQLVFYKDQALDRPLDILAFAPLAIPNIVIAIAILLLYIRTPLYGTIWIIIIAQITAYLAFGTRTINAGLIQIHPELENAATACGSSWITMMRKILLPMLPSPHFINGWL